MARISGAKHQFQLESAQHQLPARRGKCHAGIERARMYSGEPGTMTATRSTSSAKARGRSSDSRRAWRAPIDQLSRRSESQRERRAAPRALAEPPQLHERLKDRFGGGGKLSPSCKHSACPARRSFAQLGRSPVRRVTPCRVDVEPSGKKRAGARFNLPRRSVERADRSICCTNRELRGM